MLLSIKVEKIHWANLSIMKKKSANYLGEIKFQER